MSKEQSNEETTTKTWEPLDTWIQYLSSDSFYKFVKQWDHFHVGQLVTTDFNERESKVVRKITKITLWTSQTGICITSVPVIGKSQSDCLAIDSAWYKVYDDPNSKKTASLEEFF